MGLTVGMRVDHADCDSTDMTRNAHCSAQVAVIGNDRCGFAPPGERMVHKIDRQIHIGSLLDGLQHRHQLAVGSIRTEEWESTRTGDVSAENHLDTTGDTLGPEIELMALGDPTI